MERSERRDDLEAAGAAVVAPAPRQLERGLVGLRAGVAEEHPPIAEMAAQTRRQPRHRLGVEDVGDVRKLLGLFLDRAHDAGMAVPQRSHGEAAEKIQIAIAVGVIEIGAGAAHEGERHAAVGVDEILMGEVDDLSVIHRCPSWIPHRVFGLLATDHAASTRCALDADAGPGGPSKLYATGRRGMLAPGLAARNHLGAHARFGENLKQDSVARASVDHVGLADASIERRDTALDLRDHPVANRACRDQFFASATVSVGMSLPSLPFTPSTSVSNMSFSAPSAARGRRRRRRR